ncbi:hypothetical protein Rsub_12376 [Raphidocelis subcapitata]|uniref:Uncharacterized protein n=1 Tax=Raphidocelis subcapitata TaxID=307507 RepID=A0A2V0PKX0_9CHLO|nr:hypothetical protein Rsub_12376 [Raphidocelis subcapitata]|eukprot:GBF99682.1 hypothetical protein Rsub_12376 [Raphidocelis subcapitata]
MEAALPLELDEVVEVASIAAPPPQRRPAAAAPGSPSKARRSGGAAADALAWARRAAAAHLRSCRDLLAKLKDWLRRLIDFVLDEFEPWFKWVVLDAALALVVAVLAARVEPLRVLFETIGWA